ncbi:MAG TPA: hypothetical protein VIL46_01765, partial [Gemmataceae bacterium]
MIRSLALLLALTAATAATAAEGTLLLRVLDRATGEPVPCRVHLTDPAGKPHRPPGLPFWHDHFVCEGSAELRLPTGRYRYEVERGPEYSAARGTVE